MLRHQDLPIHAYEGQGGAGGSAALLQNRKSDKDGNFNFLSGKDDDGVMATRNGGGDENRNQVRPRTLSPLGLEPSSPSSSSGFHHGLGPLSPLSRLPCWSPLEPLPEVESGDDGYGRVPPDGAEERKMTEEEMRRGVMLTSNDKKERETRQGTPQERRGKAEFRGGELQEEEEGLDDDSEWGESDSEFGFSLRSTGSLSSLNMESGTEGVLMGGWDRIGVGEPRPDHHSGGASDTSTTTATTADPTRKWDGGNKGPTGRRITSFGRETLPGTGLGTNSLEELEEEEEDKEGDREEEEEEDDRSSDSDDELPELMDAVWTLRDRERFKAQEMEKHQVQLTMYRRLALIRWVRTLQGRVQEQQNRLQSSFDVILTHRKELLRMGAAAAVTSAPPTATVGQS